MARLPEAINTGTAVAQRATTAAVAPTDFGLGAASQSLAAYGEARRRADDAEAAQVLREAQAAYEPAYAERAAAYDGQEAGWAARETETFDATFSPLLAREDLPGGVRDALRAQVETYKTQVGGQAIGLESQRRAAVVAERRRVLEETQAHQRVSAFDALFAEDLQGVEDSFDGSQPDYAARLMEAYDARTQEVLEGTPEALRPAVERTLSAKRVTQFAQALVTEDEAQDAYVAGQARAGAGVLVNSVLSNPAGYAGALERVESLGAGLPARLRNGFAAEVRADLTKARVQGLIDRGEFVRAQEELAGGQYDALLPPEAKAQLVDAARTEAASHARNLIEAMSWGAGADPGELSAAARASGDVGLQAQATYALAVGAAEGDALGMISRGETPANVQADIDFVIEIEGGDAIVEDDNGRGVTRFGINQTANPDLDVRNLTRAQASARYRRYRNEVGADNLPPALALVAFDAAVNHGPAKAREMLAEAEGDPGRLLALREAEYRRLAAAEPRHARQLSGWMNRLEKVGARAAQLQAMTTTQEGLSSDPIRFAAEKGVAQPSALPQDMNDPAFGRALAQRLRLGQTMNRDYRAPQRMLTNAETAFYRDMIERDPRQALELAKATRGAVGPEAAKALFAEIGAGGNGGVHLHLADLAVYSETFASAAASGLSLMANGDKLDDATLKREIREAMTAVEPSLAGEPDLRLIAQRTAEAAALADLRRGVDRRGAAYVQSALGAVRAGDRVYGGVARVNGAATLLPSWLDRDYVDDAMGWLAETWATHDRGPSYPSGRPIPAHEVRKLRPVYQPATGRYRLETSDGREARARSGGPFEMDLEAAKKHLTAVLPTGAILRGNP